MKGLDIRASATIEQVSRTGPKSGPHQDAEPDRVRVRVRTKRADRDAPVTTYRPWKGRYRADRSVAGKGVETRCISAPSEEWAAIDAEAQRRLMSRSEFLRRAARVLLDSPNDDGSGATSARSTSKSEPNTTARRLGKSNSNSRGG